MKIRKLAVILFILFAVVPSITFLKSYADEPDPLALPCTIGATATKQNPITKKDDKFTCEQCGPETCWIIQPEQK